MRSLGTKKTFLKILWPYFSYALWYGWMLFRNLIILSLLLGRKKYVLYLADFIPFLLLISYFQFYALREIWGKNYSDTWLGTIFFYLFITFLGTAVYLGYRYLIDKNNYFKLESLKKEIELQQLQDQLNPHFLFNSLNNIYSYALEKKHSDVLILKLSQVMRFIVEFSRKDKIEVEQELEFIENYIQFEQERLGKRCAVRFDARVKSPKRRIAPLLFFPFIKNAFKYGRIQSISHLL
jgi:sensor histidine kinase YesM